MALKPSPTGLSNNPAPAPTPTPQPDAQTPRPSPSPNPHPFSSVHSRECVGEALSDLQLAEDLVRTCYEMYRRTPTGLAPEIVHFVDRSGGRGWILGPFWKGAAGAGGVG